MGKEFVATDGTVFQTKKEWRKHEMATRFSFKEKIGETLPPKKPGDVDGQQFDMGNLTGCEAVLADASDMAGGGAGASFSALVGAATLVMSIPAMPFAAAAGGPESFERKLFRR